jgi:short-subunit dehydrogenase
MNQSKKVVLLTGATGGLGSAIAKHLNKDLYTVYGAGRKTIHTNDYIPVYMDLLNPNSISQTVQQIIKKEGKIDILINNAGIGITGGIEETQLTDVKKVFEVNFFGMMQLIQEVLPYMRKQKNGIIINISSIAGYTGLPYRGIYSATKAAVMRMTEALSAELYPFGIKVVEVAPGDFKTKIAEGRIYTKLKKDSPYYNDYNRILKMIDVEVEKGLEPDVLGKKVSKIISKKNPKLTYNIGIFMQKLAPYLATCLPGRFFENLILKHYKIKK